MENGYWGRNPVHPLEGVPFQGLQIPPHGRYGSVSIDPPVITGPPLAHSGNQSGGHHGHNPYPSRATEAASQLISPLRVAFGPRGNYLVAEAVAGQLTSISPTGAKSVVVSAPG